ncbi:hypothetical protein HHK36_000966 [Tetracentron sinense]|uniref:Luc7-like protein 3 n=1 Tax=Tetracentron sinense TaxID=13715 RepID=A0A834ZRZ9_TETSI|nr:hypothetical protein HHK36_000966 [Tetracentron sinense]
MDAQRALLDELMGAARDLTEEEKKGYKEICWDDKEVCGFYMVRFCPHDLFVNTRSDLGPCPRIHDQKLKERFLSFEVTGPKLPDQILAQKGGYHFPSDVSSRFHGLFPFISFEKSPRHDSYVPRFEAELAQFCERLVIDLDRRVRRGRERLAQEVEVTPAAPISTDKSEQLSVLEEKIKNLLEQAETLGEAGKVDEAEALMRKVEMLNAEKTTLTQQPQNDKLLMLTQEKKMALCETCGSFLVANDAAERTQSHVTGKQHIGYGMVRDFISEYKEAKEKVREEERLTREKAAEQIKQRDKENENRGRSNSRERDRYHDRNQDRERDRHRERDGGRERSREWSGRGSWDGGRGMDRNHNHYRNGREVGRDRYRDRNGNIERSWERRSRSPVRHGRRRSSRSPVRPY